MKSAFLMGRPSLRIPPSDDGFLANVNMGDPEWRGLQEMAKQSNDYRSLIPGNLDLGGVVARYLVYRGSLKRVGREAQSLPARTAASLSGAATCYCRKLASLRRLDIGSPNWAGRSWSAATTPGSNDAFGA
jgi:hypothetical protein